ncbi:MAG: hypothetical protein DWQ37_04860 [Planctomycetota bacterium]|nr:MAG: hypothetical protein DWQ37_04860 [Planctomycetota bacterium]
MHLVKPIAAYNAATNHEAHLVKMCLIEAGIDAAVTEDHSLVGYWMLGTLPEIHKPQVWISACDAERAKSVLRAFEQSASARREPRETGGETPVNVVCDECGQTSAFPAAQRGTIQYCPRCGAHVDVDDADDQDRYGQESQESSAPD